MSKKAKVMLILACIFATITVILVAFDAFVSFSSYAILFGSHPENFGEALGDALGGILLYVYTILLGIVVLICGAIALPFDIILLRINGKKWYAFVILGVVVTAMLMAIVFVAMLPAISEVQKAVQNANSSSSNPDSTAALLMY